MKKFVLLATVLTSAFSSAALAQDSDTAKVTVLGNVARLCVLGTPSDSVIDLGQMAETSGTRVGKLTTIANRSATLPGSFCNFAKPSL